MIACYWCSSKNGNENDFAQTGQDTVNTRLKTFQRIAPGFFRKADKEIAMVVENRIAQTTSLGGKKSRESFR